MSTDAGVVLICVLMVVHLGIGLPLFAVLGLGSLCLILWTGTYSLSVFGEAPFQAMDNWALLAMPLFILSGDIVSSGKMAKAIVRLGSAVVGWIRGGLGMTTIAACFFFAGTSGSNAADTAAVGRIMVPRLVERGYPIDYAAALAAAGGCMGIIVPPSLMFIIYGVITSTSVGDLFIAGLLPGLVMAMLMCLAIYIEVRAKRIGGGPAAFSVAELGRATWNCKYGLGAPAIILGGIYSGIFTPTEAAAVAVVYCIVVEMFVNRAVRWRELRLLFARSGVIIGLIGPVIIFSLMFGEVIALLRLPEAIATAFLTYASNPNTFLICVMLLLLVVGCFMETIAALLILMPILIPVVKVMGIDPVHFGVFSVCALTIGFITPPVGLNLFVASAISGRPYMNIASRVVPLFLALVVATILVGWVPWLSLWFK
jgi:C4-dicarboxylate transporter DctM subunit